LAVFARVTLLLVPIFYWGFCVFIELASWLYPPGPGSFDSFLCDFELLLNLKAVWLFESGKLTYVPGPGNLIEPVPTSEREPLPISAFEETKLGLLGS